MVTFKSLGLNAQLLKAVEKLGFENPTEIQTKVIPLLLEQSKDLVALAQTGTGKTAAFGFPMLQKINTEQHNTQGLIIAPTRELCLQITTEMNSYASELKKINIVAVYGGANISEQAKKLKRGAQIVVATPGRLKDMIKRKMVNISAIQYCVLDEADEMLNMGFYEDIKDILTHTPNDKDSWLFSATMPHEVSIIAKKFMHQPHEVTVGTKNSGAKNINHHYYTVAARERYQTLKALLGLHSDLFGCVFCRTKIETQKVADRLTDEGYKAAALHGDLSQNQRDAVMQSFRKKKIQLLIATDVAARGIDVDDLTHVIHYNIPDEVEIYTHRSGRTGRAGKTGTSILFATKSDQRKIRLIENKIQTKIIEQQLPAPEEILKHKVAHWVSQIKSTPLRSELLPFVPDAVKGLEELDKSLLVELLLSRDFKEVDFRENYNSAEGRKEKKYDREERVINAPEDKDRFFINIGARDQYDWKTLKDFVRSYLNLDRDDVFQVEVMKNFSFFSTHKKHRKHVLNAFENLVLDDRKVIVEETKKGKTYSPKFFSKKNKKKRR